MIPVAEPCLAEADIAAAIECLRSGWISSAGSNIERFEKAWAAYCGRKHGIAVSNGSVALDAAVKLLDLSPGDEVILPSFTIISCARAIVANGGVPVVVDQSSRDWQMDVSRIEAKITPRTKAVMVVHIYGHPVDMDPVLELCRRHDLKLIEDAAEAHGALYKGRPCGSFGDVSTFSFFANKLITTGEGGMLLVNDDALADRARAYRNLCFQPKRRFLHEELGQNYRMTNLQAAIGLNQVARIEEIVARKRAIAARYRELLSGVPGISLAAEEPWARNVYWVFGVLLDPRLGEDCTWLTRKLADMGVETRPFFLGMHEQPVLRRMGFFEGESCPVAENLARRGFYIPSGLTISDAQIESVAAALRTCLSASPAEPKAARPSVAVSGEISKSDTAVYGKAFYDSQKSLSLRSAEAVVPLVCEMIAPESVIDFGCGMGTWLSVFARHGVRRIKGLEISDLPEGEYLIDKSSIMTGVNFASNSFNVASDAELAVCLEVAEHVHQDYAGSLVKNLTASAPLVLFSAAYPGQTGVNHINEQPLHYWRALFEAAGFREIDCVRPSIRNNPEVAWWYRQNITLFASEACIRDNPRVARLHARWAPLPDSRDRIAYVSEWVIEKQREAAKNVAALLGEISESLLRGNNVPGAIALTEMILSLEVRSESLFRHLSSLYRAAGNAGKAAEYESKAKAYEHVRDAAVVDAKAVGPRLVCKQTSSRRVSIVVPTYNRAADLSDLLRALGGLDYDRDDFEVLVVDNNSTDSTKAVVESFKGALPNLHYHHETAPGLHAARHRGLREAKHDILLYCDDDIVPGPSWLRGVSEAFSDDAVQLVTGKISPRYQRQPPPWLSELWNRTSHGMSLGWLTLLDFGDELVDIPPNFVWGANFAVRKEVVAAGGGFHPDSVPQALLKYRGDGESGLTRKIAKSSGKAVYHPLCSVEHKVSSERMTLDYLYKRCFAQGISDSYSAVRESGELQKIKQATIGGNSLRDVIQMAMAEGWNYHQRELREDRELIGWVRKESYL